MRRRLLVVKNTASDGPGSAKEVLSYADTPVQKEQ